MTRRTNQHSRQAERPWSPPPCVFRWAGYDDKGVACGSPVGLVVRVRSEVAMSQRSTTKTIEAERFVLRDKQGEARAVLETARDGAPRLALRDKDGTDRLALLVCPDGAPMVNLCDHEGKIRLEILVTHDGDPDLNFLDEEGAIRLNLGVARSGAPELGL